MAKRHYRSPRLMGLDNGWDVVIVIGGSQGTSGYDSIFSFQDDDLASLLGDWSDEDLATLDADGDCYITWDEYGEYYG